MAAVAIHPAAGAYRHPAVVPTMAAAATPTTAAIPMCIALDWSCRRMEGIRIRQLSTHDRDCDDGLRFRAAEQSSRRRPPRSVLPACQFGDEPVDESVGRPRTRLPDNEFRQAGIQVSVE